ELARAEFHARGAVLRIARDELALPAGAHGAEVLARRRVEPPNLLPRTRDAVAEGEAAPVFIEPQLAVDLQAGGLLLAHPAHPLLEAKAVRRLPAVDRQVAPFIGEGRLRDVDRR